MKKPRILLVDDDVGITRTLGLYLAVCLDRTRQIVERDRIFRVRLAKDAATDGERFAKQRFRPGGVGALDAVHLATA